MDLTVLRTFSKAKGIKILDISKRVGIARLNYSLVERGKKRVPLDVLERICGELGLEVRICLK